MCGLSRSFATPCGRVIVPDVAVVGEAVPLPAMLVLPFLLVVLQSTVRDVALLAGNGARVGDLVLQPYASGS